jgi:hypothetical protein
MGLFIRYCFYCLFFKHPTLNTFKLVWNVGILYNSTVHIKRKSATVGEGMMKIYSMKMEGYMCKEMKWSPAIRVAWFLK